MVFFSRARHFLPLSKRRMPPLAAKYRMLYEKMVVSILNVAYMFGGTLYVTNFFTCTYDKEMLNYPIWQITERVMTGLNLGTHGSVPFPYIYTFTDMYQQENYCNPDMFMIPWIDFINFMFNCYWMKICAMRYNSLWAKDLVTFEVIYLVDLFKAIMQFSIPVNFRYERTAQWSIGLQCLMKIVHSSILTISIYIEYLYICKLKEESEEMRSKCIGLQIKDKLQCLLSDEDKDLMKTTKTIDDLVYEILDV